MLRGATGERSYVGSRQQRLREEGSNERVFEQKLVPKEGKTGGKGAAREPWLSHLTRAQDEKGQSWESRLERPHQRGLKAHQSLRATFEDLQARNGSDQTNTLERGKLI